MRGDRQSSVLRNASFGDIDIRHDFQSADDARADVPRRPHHFVKHAVDTEPHPQVGFGWLEVNIGGAVLNCLSNQQVHKPDNRGFFGDFVYCRKIFLFIGLGVEGRAQITEFGFASIEAIDRRHHVGLRRHHSTDIHARCGPQVVNGEHVARIGHRDEQPVILNTHRNRRVSAAQHSRDERDRTRLDGGFGQIEELETDLGGQRSHHLSLGQQPAFNQDATERGALALKLCLRIGELLRREQAVLQQNVAELPHGPSVRGSAPVVLALDRSFGRKRENLDCLVCPHCLAHDAQRGFKPGPQPYLQSRLLDQQVDPGYDQPAVIAPRQR